VRVPYGLSGSVNNVGADASIVDCTPTIAEHGTFRTNVVCRVGNSITDPKSGITLTTLSRTATALTVRVDYARPDRSLSADVVVSGLKWAPGTPVAGKPLAAVVDSINQGAHPAHEITARLRIDRGNDSSWDVDLTSPLVVPTMYPGYMTTHKFSPAWTPVPGLHRYEIRVSGKYLEYDGVNDCVSGTFAVADPVSASDGSPDLLVETMGFSKMPPPAGVEATFNATVRNAGGAAAAAQQATLTIDEGNDGSIDVGPIALPLAALASKETTTAKWPEIWTPQPGMHKVNVCVDTGTAVTESNEGNNCVATVFVVTAGPG
jgi:hypothetical protein